MRFLVILFFSLSLSAQIPDSFVNAIHQVETQGRYGAIIGTKKELGPLQITYKCWRDCHIKGKFKDCADYEYSVRVLNVYLNRYGKEFIRNKDYGSLARIWNGGPDGRKKTSTLEYSRKVLKIIDVEKNKK